MERIERYGSNGTDLDFQQIAVTADDVRGERLVAHEANAADSDFKRFREECLREGLDPYSAVEVEALSPGVLRRRLDSAIEGLVQDVHQWNILARAEDRGPSSNRRENHGVATDLRRHAVAGHAGPAMAHQKRVEQDGNCQTEGRSAHCIGEAA
ncbi:hypothetical protein WEB32_00965 [Streptomyces netropsis]|uniref:hypothetical protein n=1 Tax=Streptomyces netropsis TaxID=55404 RepID=UPI0030CF0440